MRAREHRTPINPSGGCASSVAAFDSAVTPSMTGTNSTSNKDGGSATSAGALKRVGPFPAPGVPTALALGGPIIGGAARRHVAWGATIAAREQ